MAGRTSLASSIKQTIQPLIDGIALAGVLRDGYRRQHLTADLGAGITVGIIALPLAMALAIASGVPPQYGIYTALAAGTIAALLGGSRYNVTGPTAAFVVLLAPIAATYGLGGLAVATMMAGTILIIMGVTQFGRLIQFIPHPVTTGFTAGIAVVIATLQIKDFLGLRLAHSPDHFLDKMAALSEALSTWRWSDTLIGVVTLALLTFGRRLVPRMPPALVATTLGAVLAWVLTQFVPGFSVNTIASRFSYVMNGETRAGIPAMLPAPGFPWNLPGPDGAPVGFSLELVRALIMPATTIAMLGAIESLLCSVAADGMAGTRHNPNTELVAQGAANVVAPFFGGIAATGAIARTAANIRAGAVSPVASLFHVVFLAAAVLLLAPLLGYLPMASLAALLFVVAWNMSHVRHFVHMLKVAPRSDVAVLLTCFSLTVIFDMVIAVGVGVVLAALLFMRRMAELAESHLLDERHELLPVRIPRDVLAYEIAGPLFFGAAEKVFGTLAEHRALQNCRAFIINMRAAPVMDMTGLVALESVLAKAEKAGVLVLLAGVAAQPRKALQKAGITARPGKLAFVHDLEQAIMIVELEKGLPSESSVAVRRSGQSEIVPRVKG